MKKNVFLISLFCIGISSIIAFVIISCENISDESVDCETYDFSKCNTTEPAEGKIFVKLTINSENTAVPLYIYKGKLEENNIIYYDTISSASFDTLLPVDNYYTVAAKYKKGNVCDSVCWSVEDAEVNVKLK